MQPCLTPRSEPVKTTRRWQRFLSVIDAWPLLILLVLCQLTTSTAANAATLLVMGDSLSAGYGIQVEQGWVALLTQRLAAQGYGYTVVNASVSGETSGGGKARLPALLNQHKPNLVILELGANDGLRGLPTTQLRSNLGEMINSIRQSGAQTLLVGMQLPPNYGQRYTDAFAAVYPQLAKQYQLKLVPFLMDGVALKPEWMQADNLHPNALGQARLLDNVWSELRGLLKK